MLTAEVTPRIDVVLGAADRLFGEMQNKIVLRLVESRPSGGGVVKMIYEPAMADG